MRELEGEHERQRHDRYRADDAAFSICRCRCHASSLAALG
jgi:hypothetical protein